MSILPVISIQGHPGSFHDIARRKYFKNGHDLLCRDDFKRIFKDIQEGSADFAVIAAENSLYGSLHQVYDLLQKHRHWISGEIYLRIEHCLLGVEGAEAAGIKEVHSHPIALAQCEEYLDTVLFNAERFEHHDTAASAANVAQWNDTSKAAIASQEAGKLHGLKTIAKNVETNKHNYTRFIVLQKKRSDTAQTSDKSSIILYTDHQPGALHRALGVFAEFEINLTKLESRPIIGKAWHYMFYIDFEAGLHEARTLQAFGKLKSTGNQIIELGSYLRGIR
ncbi:prephenate dehydratase [soil metagenome]